MAIKPVDNESFYREVDEELRRDQMVGFWTRYGKLMIGAVLLLLAVVAGVLYWQHRQELRAGETAETMTKLLDDIAARRSADIGPRLDALAKDSSDGYRAAALLTKADIAAEQGRDSEAIAGYRTVASDEGIAQPYRDLALIRQTTMEFDKLPPATVVTRLTPYAKAGNPWFGSAGELVALAYLQQNKPKQAAPIFAAMARDETLPSSIRTRAQQMAGSLGVDATEQAEGTM